MLSTRPLLFLATLLLTAFAAGTPANAAPEASPAIEVWKSPNCGCCQKWADYLTENGFAVTAKNTTQGMLNRIKSQAGIGPKIAACHTALIDGYAIEGHVPAADIKRLLEERPDADAVFHQKTFTLRQVFHPGQVVRERRRALVERGDALRSQGWSRIRGVGASSLGG